MESKIQITRGLSATVDASDFARLSAMRWWAMPRRGDKFYAARSVVVSGRRATMFMHRAVMGHVPAGMVVDHINGDGLDNRRQNLRICTIQQNAFNRDPTCKTSAFPGVSFNSSSKKWDSRIEVSAFVIHLGLYSTELNAAAAYDLAASAIFNRPRQLEVGDIDLASITKAIEAQKEKITVALAGVTALHELLQSSYRSA